MCGLDDAVPPDTAYRTPHVLRPGPSPLTATAQAALHQAPVASVSGDLVIEAFPLEFAGYTYTHSRICYVADRPPAPLVLVHANYAGLKQFDIDVAAFLARIGYVGLAVDLYKDVPGTYEFKDRNPVSTPPGEALEVAIQRHRAGSNAAMDDLLRSPRHWRGLLRAYLDAASAHRAVQPGLAGAIGYCLGGQCVLEHVRDGHPLQAVVSFHGVYHSRPRHPSLDRRLTPEEFAKDVDLAPNAYNRSCRVLIEHGDHDNRDGRDPASIAAWRAEMDAAGIDWQFHNHARTPHGFALAPGVWSNSYSETADRRSTLSMLSLFAETWPEFPQFPVEANACGTRLGQHISSTHSHL